MRQIQFGPQCDRPTVLCRLLLRQPRLGLQEVGGELLFEERARVWYVDWGWDGGLGAYRERVQELLE